MVGTRSDTRPRPSQSHAPVVDLSEFGIPRVVGTSSALGNPSWRRRRPAPPSLTLQPPPSRLRAAHRRRQCPQQPRARSQIFIRRFQGPLDPPQPLSAADMHTSPSGPRCPHPDAAAPLGSMRRSSLEVRRPAVLCVRRTSWSQSPITQEASTGAVGPSVWPGASPSPVGSGEAICVPRHTSLRRVWAKSVWRVASGGALSNRASRASQRNLRYRGKVEQRDQNIIIIYIDINPRSLRLRTALHCLLETG